MIELYLWLKALHIFAVIAWMAGLFYLPRLFVYHAAEAPGSAASQTFKTMERRLLRGIMNPAMIAVWLLGGALLWVEPGWLYEGWLHAKLVLVSALTVYHHALARWRKHFAADRNRHDPRFYRMMNEVPTLLLLGILAMVVVKPF